MMTGLRTGLAVLALATLGALALLLIPRDGSGPPGSERLGIAIILLLLPLAWASAGPCCGSCAPGTESRPRPVHPLRVLRSLPISLPTYRLNHDS